MVADEREERTFILLLLPDELPLLAVASRTELLLCEEAEARVVPCEEAVVAEALEARAVLMALVDSRVLALPNVRAAADARASLGVREKRVPSAEGADEPRVDAPVRALPPAEAIAPERDADVRLSRCN